MLGLPSFLLCHGISLSVARTVMSCVSLLFAACRRYTSVNIESVPRYRLLLFVTVPLLLLCPCYARLIGGLVYVQLREGQMAEFSKNVKTQISPKNRNSSLTRKLFWASQRPHTTTVPDGPCFGVHVSVFLLKNSGKYRGASGVRLDSVVDS